MRPTLGVIVAFVAMMALVLGLSMGLWFALGVDGVLLPGRFDGTSTLNVWAVLACVVGGLFAGWLCATISRSRTATIVLAVLCFLNGAGNAFAHWNKPEPGPRARADDYAGDRKEKRACLVHAADPGCGHLQCATERITHDRFKRPRRQWRPLLFGVK